MVGHQTACVEEKEALRGQEAKVNGMPEADGGNQDEHRAEKIPVGEQDKWREQAQ